MNSPGFAFPRSNAGQQLLSRQVKLLLIACSVAAISAFLPLEGIQIPLASYVPIHTLLEFLSILIGFLVFATVWCTPAREQSASVVVISLALLAASGADLLHMMSIVGMPDFVTPSSSQKSISFWLSGRYAAAIGVLLGSFIPQSTGLTARTRFAIALAFFFYLMAVASIVLFYAPMMPEFFVAGTGTTTLKRVAEILLVLLIAWTAWRYYHE